MHFGRDALGGPGDDGEAAFAAIGQQRVFGLPQSGQPQHLVRFLRPQVIRLLTAGGGFPLVIPGYRNGGMPRFEGGAERRLFVQAFHAGVEGVVTEGGLFGPERHQAPVHFHQACVFAIADQHAGGLAGRQIVAGRQQREIGAQGRPRHLLGEGDGNLGESAAHGAIVRANALNTIRWGRSRCVGRRGHLERCTHRCGG